MIPFTGICVRLLTRSGRHAASLHFVCFRLESVKNHPLLCLFLPLPVSQRSKISLGSKALSHDSVFVSDSSEANEALGASQDSIHGKVKSLQVNTHEIYWGSCVKPDL